MANVLKETSIPRQDQHKIRGTLDGSRFWGDSTLAGFQCLEASFYNPEFDPTHPLHIRPIRGQCVPYFTNKRYFKYKVRLNYIDTDSPSNGGPDEGDATARVDEVILNFGR